MNNKHSLLCSFFIFFVFCCFSCFVAFPHIHAYAIMNRESLASLTTSLWSIALTTVYFYKFNRECCSKRNWNKDGGYFVALYFLWCPLLVVVVDIVALINLSHYSVPSQLSLFVARLAFAESIVSTNLSWLVIHCVYISSLLILSFLLLFFNYIFRNLEADFFIATLSLAHGLLLIKIGT